MTFLLAKYEGHDEHGIHIHLIKDEIFVIDKDSEQMAINKWGRGKKATNWQFFNS